MIRIFSGVQLTRYVLLSALSTCWGALATSGCDPSDVEDVGREAAGVAQGAGDVFPASPLC